MPDTWYVTFEVRRRGVLPKRRSPRVTRRFGTEAEARRFAKAKFYEGLVVFAGTINPHAPKQLITPGNIPLWVDQTHDEGTAKPEGGGSNDG